MRRLDLVSRDAHRVALGGGSLDYVLVRRRGRRGVGLRVDENGLTVSAPVSMPLARVEAVVRESEEWVLRKVREWSARQVPVLRWEDGTRLPFLGGGLALRLRAGTRAHALRVGEELHVTHAPGEAAIRRAVTGWYRGLAREFLQRRLLELAQAAGIAAPQFLLSSARARWGSCNTKREIRLAWRLVKAPPRLVDYVICHELAHLRHMNHSRAFWAEVERQCPDYRARRKELYATDFLYRSF